MSELKIDQTREYVIAKGLEHDCVTFFAEPNELLLDLDLLHQPRDLNETVDGFIQKINCESGQEPVFAALDTLGTVWKSVLKIYPRLTTISRGGNRHVYIRLARPYPELVRIALQACLGSDPTREMLSALQSEVGMPAAVALYETATEAPKVEAWRSGT